MLIDDVTIRVKAGDGGDGGVAFNKNLKSLGPAGGDGGKGGSVFFEGVPDLGALAQFRKKKELIGGDGKKGGFQFMDGPDGEDVVSRVPVGTVIHNLDTAEDIEILHSGERVRVARGGHGGNGNFKFRSSTNTTPMQFQKGTAGEQFKIRLELKLIADVGLVGLPNAGKSSLLNELTGAKSKVANYPFTTLEPNLGAYYELILADIPGLIEGASMGKGLGIKFLHHIERTKTVFHLVSAESEDPVAVYRTVRTELEHYSPALAAKDEHVFLSKSDMVSESELEKKLKALKSVSPTAMALSIHDEESLEAVKVILNGIQAGK